MGHCWKVRSTNCFYCWCCTVSMVGEASTFLGPYGIVPAMTNPTHITIGFVCPRTGRVAVPLQAFARSEFNGEVSSYFYSQANDESGADPWATIDSVDVPVEGNNFDIWFSDGSCRQNVPGDAIIFVRSSVAQTIREKSPE